MLDFAGGNNSSTILSNISNALLPMFTIIDACSLRLLCKEFNESVTDFRWDDSTTRVTKFIHLWKICFPHAKTINISNTKITDLDFIHLKHVNKINMANCNLVTDEAFKYLQDTGKYRI